LPFHQISDKHSINFDALQETQNRKDFLLDWRSSRSNWRKPVANPLLGKPVRCLKTSKNKKGTRLFSKEDIETVKLIHHLVKERGLTLKGAQQKLKDNKEETINNFEIVQRLQDVRKQLVEIGMKCRINKI
jgi:hypothetical protein